MKALFTEEEYKTAKTKDKLPCECEHCGTTFFKLKHDISKVYSGYRPGWAKFCSKKCQFQAAGFVKYNVGKPSGQQCKQCDNQGYFYSYETTGDFCSKLCAKTYSSVVNKEKKNASLRQHYATASTVGCCAKFKSGHYIMPNGNKIYLRSGYEFKLAAFLDNKNIEYTYEKVRIPYELNGAMHTYVSDFYLPAYNMILDPKNSYQFSQNLNKYHSQYDAITGEGIKMYYLFHKEIQALKHHKTFESYYNFIKEKSYFK